MNLLIGLSRDGNREKKKVIRELKIPFIDENGECQTKHEANLIGMDEI